MPLTPYLHKNYPKDTDKVIGDDMANVINSLTDDDNKTLAYIDTANTAIESNSTSITTLQSSIGGNATNITALQSELRTYQTRFTKTGMSWALTNGSTTNLVTGLGSSQAPATGLVTTTIVNPQGNPSVATLLSGASPAGITVFPIDKPTFYIITIRIMGSFGGALLASPFLTANLVLTAGNVVQSGTTTFTPTAGAYTLNPTFFAETTSTSDTLTIGGFYIQLINNSGSTYTISSLDLRVRGSL